MTPRIRAGVPQMREQANADRWQVRNLQEMRTLMRTPGERPPRDPSQWLAWARGEPTTGPRYESAEMAALRERQEERLKY